MRRSVRKYSARPISDDDIEYLLEAARVAPSSNNKQPWRFVVVRDPEKVQRLAGAAPKRIVFNRPWMSKAPCVIVCCAEPSTIFHKAVGALLPVDLAMIDITIAAEHIVLAAAELGLGTCWVGWFDERKVRDILNLPQKWSVIALLAVGWPESPLEDRKPKRKQIAEIAFDEDLESPWGQSR